MNSILFVEKSIGLIVDFVHNVNPNSIFTLNRTRTRNRLGTGPVSMGSNILCRRVHTGPRQGPVLIVYCYASPVPSTPCKVNKP